VAGAGFTGIAVALMGRNHIRCGNRAFGYPVRPLIRVARNSPSKSRPSIRDMVVAMHGRVHHVLRRARYMNRPWIARRLYLMRDRAPGWAEAT